MNERIHHRCESYYINKLKFLRVDAHGHDGKIRCYLSIHCDKDVTHCVYDIIPGTLVMSRYCLILLLYNDAKWRCQDIL